MKLLSIGNSFSRDAQKWLHAIAESAGKDIYAANLYIGGCSLEKHWNRFLDGEEEYGFDVNGEEIRKSSLKDGLLSDEWDVITFQQCSGCSGIFDTYRPYLDNLFGEVKSRFENAKFYIHETWAYEIDSTHQAFADYDNNQITMYNRLVDAYKNAANLINADIIPVGDVIQFLRTNCKEFDYANKGLSLCRDGFHLSYNYGRYAAALTWFGILFGADVREPSFIPTVEGLETDPAVIEVIKNAVYEFLKNRK